MNDKAELLTSGCHSITGTMSPEDYVNAQWLHRNWAAVGSYILYGTIALIGIAFLVAEGITVVGKGLFAGGIGGIVGVLIVDLWVLPIRDQGRQARRGFLNAKFTYTWNSETLVAESAIWQSERAWSDYVRFKESKSVLLLYHPDGTFEIFPKAWFEDTKQLNEFRSYALQANGTRQPAQA